MTAYNEQTTTGDITSWNRARQIVCDNPIVGAPSIACYEHVATRLPDGTTLEKSVGSLSYAMTDPSVEIPLVDPETFEPSETTMTAGQIWLAMASVYLWLARQRDGEPAAS